MEDCVHKVLIIDDEKNIRKSFRFYLEDQDYEVILAEDGQIGLDKMASEQPDLVLLDLRMPKVDGLDVLKQGRQMLPDVPMIVVSGANRIADVVMALRHGAWDYLEKPVQDFSIMGHAVATALEKAKLIAENKAYQTQLEDMVKKRTQELKKREKELRQAYKMEAVGTLASGIAHDFNNILSGILGFAELIQDISDKEVDADEIKKWAGYITEGGERGRELVSQILAYTREDGDTRNPVNVKGIAREAVKLLKASLPSSIELTLDATATKKAMVKGTELHQVLLNLCTNAAYAMKEIGGHISIEVKDLQLLEPIQTRFGEIQNGNYVCLTVEDNGHGMSEEILDQALTPFFTTKPKGEGTGMGLSSVHRIIREARGHIDISSRPNKGTVFGIYLPVHEGEDRDVPIEPMMSLQDYRGNETILYVDDEKTLTQLAKEFLSNLGYQVSPFISSKEALAHFEANADSFDIVITDLTMPALTGNRLVEKIRQIRPDIPSILVTGNLDTDQESGMDMFNRILKKPVPTREVAMAIREIFQNKR
ncbi:MAG: response regulator [Desulfobacterales bacterium]|nr:response regulator [Desulfobacterales bacterium]